MKTSSNKGIPQCCSLYSLHNTAFVPNCICHRKTMGLLSSNSLVDLQKPAIIRNLMWYYLFSNCIGLDIGQMNKTKFFTEKHLG